MEGNENSERATPVSDLDNRKDMLLQGASGKAGSGITLRIGFLICLTEIVVSTCCLT